MPVGPTVIDHCSGTCGMMNALNKGELSGEPTSWQVSVQRSVAGLALNHHLDPIKVDQDFIDVGSLEQRPLRAGTMLCAHLAERGLCQFAIADNPDGSHRYVRKGDPAALSRKPDLRIVK